MLPKRLLVLFLINLFGLAIVGACAQPRQILLDTDVDTDDFFALLYLLKQNRSEFNVKNASCAALHAWVGVQQGRGAPLVVLCNLRGVAGLKAVTISANAWTDAGHAVNQLYDILYMMGRDDIPVGVGGEGGILQDGTILPNVGGYVPIIEQGISTVAGCRYRQAIPTGLGGRLDVNTNYGIRKAFLPQGTREYRPLRQPTAQQVMIDAVSEGPITVFVIGAHTNFAIFLMTHPQLKKNIEHIYVMGGGVRSKNPTGCCPRNASSSCKPAQCGDHGNLFTSYTSNPYAEFNIFGDPFAAYQVFHSGIPITLVPLDATNTIPITKEFFLAFEQRQDTYEAQYCFQSLKMARDTWFDDQFFTSYFMWDSFTSGVAVSIMRNGYIHQGENEFAEMEYRNITVVTSNKPYGAYDGSNPFFDSRTVPKFGLLKDGVHSGHVQMGVQDPFCHVKSGKGKCQDGYTKEVTDPDAVRVLVAKKAKPNQDINSKLDREFFKSFLDVLNYPEQTGQFNLRTQFPYYKEVIYEPDFGKRKLGRPVLFDMDMSAGDFVALIYLLKVPVEVIDLKGILVSGTGWANAATIDIIYDVLHMMGRDDIPVGRGDLFALRQENPSFSAVGTCKYSKAIPYGSGGFLDSDTLYGLSRTLPRSPRRYTAENSVKFGAPRDTDHPELRQPLALEVWKNISAKVDRGSKITILTNGPLTNLANIILSEKNASSMIEVSYLRTHVALTGYLQNLVENVYIVGGHISEGEEEGNLFTIPSNKYAEFNMFLDPLAAKTVIESELNITLIPLEIQRKVTCFPMILNKLQLTNKTPEVTFIQRLLSRLYHLQRKHERYHHMRIFLGEILGAAILVDNPLLKATVQIKSVNVLATGDVSKDGQIVIDKKSGSSINVLDSLDTNAYYDHLTNSLGDNAQSAVIGSFSEQTRQWGTPHANESMPCHGGFHRYERIFWGSGPHKVNAVIIVVIVAPAFFSGYSYIIKVL